MIEAAGAGAATPRRGIGRRIGLTLGWLLIALALAAFAYEALLALQAGAYRMLAAGELWFRIDVSSLNLVQAVTQRYLHPALWDPALQTVLMWPAWALLGIPGALLVLAFWPRRPSGTHRPPG